MSRPIRLLLALALLASTLVFAPPALAAETCTEGEMANNALWRICIPDGWNGALAVYAHGYTNPYSPLSLPSTELPGGVDFGQLVMDQGYALAYSSYSKNGYAVREGIADSQALEELFVSLYGEPGYTYIVGGSMGGLITVGLMEQYAGTWDGGLAACGAVSGWQKSLDYVANFRVVFDYFFPDMLPGDAMNVPQEVRDNWDSVYVPAIVAATSLRRSATDQLINVTGAAYDPRLPRLTKPATVVAVLWFQVFGMDDLIETAGGNPFDNTRTWYSGSNNDLRLNWLVERYAADQAARDFVHQYYETTGQVATPLVLLQGVRDPIVPFWNLGVYLQRVVGAGNLELVTPLTSPRYGHCFFTADEMTQAWDTLVSQVEGP